MPRGYMRVNTTVVEGFEERVNYHIVNTTLGVACAVINLILLGIFLGYRPFRTRYVLLIQLCIGDLIYSMAVILGGLHRIRLYTAAYSTLTLPVRTTKDCALETWLQLKVIGDLFIPVTIFWMGVERFVAITFPLFYRMNVDGKPLKCIMVPLLSVIFVATSLSYALFTAIHDVRRTHYHCGRKATFGEGFSTFVYISNIFCNVLSTLLNLAAYVKARTMTKNVQRAQRQADIIRYYLLISVLSTVLVSLPNTIALFQVYVKTVSDAISKPAVWMQTINSGIHLFVYLALNREFRKRTLYLVRLGASEPQTTSEYYILQSF
ncbi:unnamed protein product [Heligmosomoides polygyrus]|uniref:G_PROTEIN_RECEP_F1_2 domain-containing protein n=1 Tax=Heligmosomoides polygyrus TaxID=6339 RepID=A0A3P7Z3V4_HELPZ|nr:unnamed protein product [Heligmosomoides polygyrus]